MNVSKPNDRESRGESRQKQGDSKEKVKCLEKGRPGWFSMHGCTRESKWRYRWEKENE
jgi:hypothetical protein